MNRLAAAVIPAALLLAAAGALAVGGVGVVRVTGDSMRPALRVGDFVVYRDGQGVGNGDVIVFEGGGSSPIVHRVSQVLGDGSVLTQGDANSIADRTPVEAEAIRGRVVLVVPTGWPARVDLPLRGATLLSQLDIWL